MRKDKSGIWQCLLAAAPIIFGDYIAAVSRRSNGNAANEASIRVNAEYLLVHFNHPIPQMRRCADSCLTKLIDAFPFLLWNGRLITALLNLIQALARNVDEDPECRTQTLHVAELPWAIHLQVRQEA